jgi:4-amino-4-deoxy-L-arabinose transferase-like glycosyltransferase
LNIEEILNGNWPIFFPSFPGREALFFYWASIFARLFGNSHLTIKVAAAVIGTLTIPVTYLVARRLFDTGTGICAAAILAVSHWHIILSRIGYRAILMPLFVLVLAYLVAEAVDSPRDWHMARVGLWLGLGLYTYNSFLFAVPAFVVVMLVYWIARRGPGLLAVARSIGITALGAFLVWVPLARYAYEHPEVYLQRVQSRLTGAEKPLPADVLGTLVNNIARTLGMFNFRGDEVFTVNVPFMREMGLITAVLFVLGLGYALVHWRRGFNAITLGWFFTMLLPSALSIAFPNEVPSSDRAGGGVAMAMLIAAIPLPLLGRQLFQALPMVRGGPWALPLGSFRGRRARIKGALELGTRWLLAAAALVLFVFEARAAFQTVFTAYVAKQPGANYSVSRELARILDDFVGNGPEYIEYWPHWFDGHALEVQLTRTTSDEIYFVDNLAREAPTLADAGERALFLLHPEDQQALATLYRAFPRGSAIRYFDGLGNVRIIAFYAERQP